MEKEKSRKGESDIIKTRTYDDSHCRKRIWTHDGGVVVVKMKKAREEALEECKTGICMESSHHEVVVKQEEEDIETTNKDSSKFSEKHKQLSPLEIWARMDRKLDNRLNMYTDDMPVRELDPLTEAPVNQYINEKLFQSCKFFPSNKYIDYIVGNVFHGIGLNGHEMEDKHKQCKLWSAV